MADITDTLKSILGSDAENTIKNVVGSLAGGSKEAADDIDAGSIQALMQIKDIAGSLASNRSDPRANLLLSLKPYMREGRKQSIDDAVKLMGIMNIARMLGKQL